MNYLCYKGSRIIGFEFFTCFFDKVISHECGCNRKYNRDEEYNLWIYNIFVKVDLSWL